VHNVGRFLVNNVISCGYLMIIPWSLNADGDFWNKEIDTMFTKIDIKKFGLYKDFMWPEDLHPFGRLNIIYGRNYSGKTTLSRIFDSVGQGELHKDYMDGEFTLYTDDTATPTVTEKNMKACPYNIMVYNADFVKRNLSWLNDEEDGEIKPFALIGSENVEVQKAIDKLKDELGDVDKKTGLQYEYERRNEANETAWEKYRKKEQGLESQLKEKANKDIKTNVHYVKPGATYNVANLKNDIETITKKDEKGELRLNHDYTLKLRRRERLIETLDQNLKPVIEELPLQIPGTRINRKKVENLLKQKIRLTNTLQELVEDELLQAWVDQGRKVNRGRTTCAFCGNPISKGRWNELSAHFNKQSEELKQKLLEEKRKLELADHALDGFLESRYFTSQNIYVVYQSQYETLRKIWEANVDEYHKGIAVLLEAIERRLKNIFIPITLYERTKQWNPTSLVRKMNDLIKKNNAYSEQLDADKEEARNKLRLSYVYTYCKDINYTEVQTRLQNEAANLIIAGTLVVDVKKKIDRLEAQIAQKELEKTDESRAAKRVTDLLADHFGNGSLSLEPEMVEDKVNAETGYLELAHIKFVIKRGGQPAKNLSEGEKSLISFSYFIAKMEDELKGDEAENLVVYIDDPISSLDSNHIFFIYSIIDTVFAKNLCFEQLFISTHNLEFLKFMKRLKLMVTSGSKERKHYVVVKSGKGTTNEYKSEIKEMPTYLSIYMTEYNYLFEQIYEVAKLNTDEELKAYDKDFTQYYNIGNIMRKFLECYLFNRYPNTDDPLKFHLKKLFDGNLPSMVNRVVNEYSHLMWAERGMRTIDLPGVVTAAKEIVNALKKKDPAHYEALCKSVGKDAGITLS